MVIKDLLKLKGLWIMTNVFNLAIKVEKQINRYFVQSHNKYKYPTRSKATLIMDTLDLP